MSLMGCRFEPILSGSLLAEILLKFTKAILLVNLMPSPSASSKFVLSVLKFLGILKFLRYTQKILGILK